MYGFGMMSINPADPDPGEVWVLKGAPDDRARITLGPKTVHGPSEPQKEYKYEYTALKLVPGGTITLDSLRAFYKVWVDPWASQKKLAAGWGFVWKDALPETETK